MSLLSIPFLDSRRSYMFGIGFLLYQVPKPKRLLGPESREDLL